jgi:tetratricopeptide (TPR) repeat protein
VAEPFAKGSGRQRVAGGIGIALACWCAVLTWMDLPRWQSSIPLFQAANRVHPHPVAYNNIGVCYLDAKQYDRAIDPLSRALELDTNYYKAFVNRATAYQKLGRIEEARRDYELILKREPKSPEGYNNRANVLLDLQDYDRAIADFSALIRLMPASAQAYNNRGAAWFMKGDNAAAIADCDQALALDPRYANAYTTRGNARSRQGDLAGALADFDRALELSPLDSLAYHNRAAVCYQLKQYDRAWQDLQRCRDLGGKPHEGLVQALMEATGRQR